MKIVMRQSKLVGTARRAVRGRCLPGRSPRRGDPTFPGSAVTDSLPKICPLIQAADAKEMRRQGELAFTMIEIAIAIGVIGFALVAIIGILPAGMNVQKDNREDTLISQDAPYFLDAIRNGAVVSNGVLAAYYSAQGLDFLTNYVQSIKFNYVVNGTNDPAKTITSNSFGSG